MNLMPIANRIHATSLGTKGVDLFIRMMPAEAANAILLRDPLSGTKINHELPNYFHTEFQLIVRATGYEAGQTTSDAVIALLTFGELTLETQAFKYCRPRTLASAFPLSKGNLVEYSVMFDCCYVGTS